MVQAHCLLDPQVFMFTLKICTCIYTAPVTFCTIRMFPKSKHAYANILFYPKPVSCQQALPETQQEKSCTTQGCISLNGFCVILREGISNLKIIPQCKHFSILLLESKPIHFQWCLLRQASIFLKLTLVVQDFSKPLNLCIICSTHIPHHF